MGMDPQCTEKSYRFLREKITSNQRARVYLGNAQRSKKHLSKEPLSARLLTKHFRRAKERRVEKSRHLNKQSPNPRMSVPHHLCAPLWRCLHRRLRLKMKMTFSRN